MTPIPNADGTFTITPAMRNFDPTGGEEQRKFEAEQKYEADMRQYLEGVREGRIAPGTPPPAMPTATSNIKADEGNGMAPIGGGGLPSGKGAADPRGRVTGGGLTATGTGTTPTTGGNVSSFMAEGAAIPQGSALTDMTKQTVLPPFYTDYAMDLLSGQKAIANRPYETAPMPRVADFTPTQQQAFGMTGTAATSYQPLLGQATQVAQAAANAPGALNTAQPFLTQAGQTSVSNIGQYMNPYTDAVVNRIADLGTRNLTENIMPEIEGRYIKAGQLGFGGRGGMGGTPSGMMTDTSRAVRDVSADILAQQTKALQSGYTEAAGLAGTDLSRFGTLANTAGNLAQTQQEQQLAASGALSSLGAKTQELGLTGAGALGDVGALQQQQGQKNLDVAYQDYLRQQGYPQEQINNMLKTFQGVSSGIPTATQEYGISPSSVKQEYPASTASQIGGGLTAAAGVIAELKKAGVI